MCSGLEIPLIICISYTYIRYIIYARTTKYIKIDKKKPRSTLTPLGAISCRSKTTNNCDHL